MCGLARSTIASSTSRDEQPFGLAHEVLVERVLPGDHHGMAAPLAAGPPPALQEAHDRAGKAGDQREVETADVDAQLERVGRHDGRQVAVEQAPFDLASLLRRVAGAIGEHALATGRGGGRRAAA